MKQAALKIVAALSLALVSVIPVARADDYKLGVSDRLKIKVQE